MWVLDNLEANNDNYAEISLFDVKELYDAAYAVKDQPESGLGVFQALLSKAERLDQAYRAQLALAAQKPFTYNAAYRRAA